MLFSFFMFCSYPLLSPVCYNIMCFLFLTKIIKPVEVATGMPLVELSSLSDVQVAYMIGDFNAHPSKPFGRELMRFCDDLLWECADIKILGADSDTHTFVSMLIVEVRVGWTIV